MRRSGCAIHAFISPDGGDEPVATGFLAVGLQSPHAPYTYCLVTVIQPTSSSASCLGSGGGDGAELSCTGLLKVLPLLREAALSRSTAQYSRTSLRSPVMAA